MIRIAIANNQRTVKIDRRLLRRAVKLALADAGVHEAEISIALVDDATSARLHADFMNDPAPTDVLSFVLDSAPGWVEGEVVANADYAAAAAKRYRWSAAEELLLYVVHGMLHLAGHDDRDPKSKSRMFRAQRRVLKQAAAALHPGGTATPSRPRKPA